MPTQQINYSVESDVENIAVGESFIQPIVILYVVYIYSIVIVYQ